MVLQVDAFAGCIGGEQDAHVAVNWVVLEGGLDSFAIVVVDAAMEDFQVAIFGETFTGEDLMDPGQCISVLGEDDDAFGSPFPLRAEMLFQPFEDGLGFAVRPVRCGIGPFANIFKHLRLINGQCDLCLLYTSPSPRD